MKLRFTAVSLLFVGLSSLVEASLTSGFTHSQVIGYLDDSMPTEIQIGMQADLSFEYTESDFTSLSFAIPEADLSFVADTINWSFGTDPTSGNNFFEITGHFEDDSYQGLDFVETNYVFSSVNGSALEMPLDTSLLSSLAAFRFTFADHDAQGNLNGVINTTANILTAMINDVQRNFTGHIDIDMTPFDMHIDTTPIDRDIDMTPFDIDINMTPDFSIIPESSQASLLTGFLVIFGVFAKRKLRYRLT
jgi:hypothetical protein